MGIFDFLNKQTAKIVITDDDVDEVDIAENIIKIMTELGSSVGGSGKEAGAYKAAQKIIDNSAKKHGGLADTQEVYLKAVELVGEAKTPREKRILASAYSLCHTEYTLYAIRAFEDYIKTGLDIPDMSNIYKPAMTKKMLEQEYVASVYAQLGALYEKNYDFEKALKCYKKELEVDTWSHFPYLYISEVYRKMNEPDKAVQILETAKKHPNYKTDKNHDLFYGDVIDRYLEEAKQRKEKGYVFRKKGHKEFLPLNG